MNSYQMELPLCNKEQALSQEDIEAAAFYTYIRHDLTFSDYKLFAEFLGAYRYIPYPERITVSTSFAVAISQFVIQNKTVTPQNLFLISHYASQIQNYSLRVQLKVASWITKLL